MVTSFTRIVVVLSLLRSAIGLQTAPPNSVMMSLALFLTAFIMAPVFERAYNDGIRPLMDGDVEFAAAFEESAKPFHGFMRQHVREKDLFPILEGDFIGIDHNRQSINSDSPRVTGQGLVNGRQDLRPAGANLGCFGQFARDGIDLVQPGALVFVNLHESGTLGTLVTVADLPIHRPRVFLTSSAWKLRASFQLSEKRLPAGRLATESWHWFPVAVTRSRQLSITRC